MRTLSSILAALAVFAVTAPLHADDLDDIQATGILRHLGYANGNFVTSSGDGLDVELVQGFADHLGVGYVFVQTDPSRAIGELIGRHVRPNGSEAELLAATPIRGDLIAAGMTIQDWRQQVVAFAAPTFPSSVWLVSLSDSRLQAIAPAGAPGHDIAQVKQQLKGVSVLAVANTRLDPARYQLDSTGADIRLAPTGQNPEELVPALMSGRAEATLLGVPEALTALERWPGRVKVVGPVSETLVMAPAFRPNATRLREAFNAYMASLRADGRYAALVRKYAALVRKYYPAAPRDYASFFATKG